MTARIIKKYPNRRLYDTELGTYITLEDIKQLVIDRIEFQVIDANSKKDLTQSTLLQIIAEQETSATPIFTTNMLQDFIRLYNEKSQDLLSQYLQQAMQTFIQQRTFFETQWKNFLNIPTSWFEQETGKTTPKQKKKNVKNQ